MNGQAFEGGSWQDAKVMLSDMNITKQLLEFATNESRIAKVTAN